MAKKFHFTADIQFDAENLDEAFALLRDHFTGLLYDEDEHDPDPWYTGEMHLQPE